MYKIKIYPISIQPLIFKFCNKNLPFSCHLFPCSKWYARPVRQMAEAAPSSPSRSGAQNWTFQSCQSHIALFFLFFPRHAHFHWGLGQGCGDGGDGRGGCWAEFPTRASLTSCTLKVFGQGAVKPCSGCGIFQQTKQAWQIKDLVVFLPPKSLLWNKNIKSQYPPQQQMLTEFVITDSPSHSRSNVIPSLPASPTDTLCSTTNVTQVRSRCPSQRLPFKEHVFTAPLAQSCSTIYIQVQPHFLCGAFPDFRISAAITSLDVKGPRCPCCVLQHNPYIMGDATRVSFKER